MIGRAAETLMQYHLLDLKDDTGVIVSFISIVFLSTSPLFQ